MEALDPLFTHSDTEAAALVAEGLNRAKKIFEDNVRGQ